jgi:hypothetical protein
MLLRETDHQSPLKTYLKGVMALEEAKLLYLKEDKSKTDDQTIESLYAEAAGLNPASQLANHMDLTPDSILLQYGVSNMNASLQIDIMELYGDLFGNYGDFLFKEKREMANKSYLASRRFRHKADSLVKINESDPAIPAKQPQTLLKLAHSTHNNLKAELTREAVKPDTVVNDYYTALQSQKQHAIKNSNLHSEIVYHWGWSIFRPFKPSGNYWLQTSEKDKIRAFEKLYEYKGGLLDRRKTKFNAGMYLLAIDLRKMATFNNNDALPIAKELSKNLYNEKDEPLPAREFIRAFVGPAIEPGVCKDRFMLKLLLKAGYLSGQQKDHFLPEVEAYSGIAESELEIIAEEVGAWRPDKRG